MACALFMNRLLKMARSFAGYRIIGAEDRRQEEAIKAQILRKLRRRMNDKKI
jgi:hypothetical protein